jgi:HEPN domain-containing protein
LSLKGVDFGKTHNLEFLLELCKKEDKEFERLDLGNLTFYAVEVRYPDEFYVPSIEETREAVKIVNETRQFIEHKLNLRLENLRKRR